MNLPGSVPTRLFSPKTLCNKAPGGISRISHSKSFLPSHVPEDRGEAKKQKSSALYSDKPQSKCRLGSQFFAELPTWPNSCTALLIFASLLIVNLFLTSEILFLWGTRTSLPAIPRNMQITD